MYAGFIALFPKPLPHILGLAECCKTLVALSLTAMKTIPEIICGLCALQAPADFVLAVLLVCYMPGGGISETYQWIEFFAGRARATLSMKAAGYRCARLDVAYFPKQVDLGMNTNYFDILSTSGFATCIGVLLSGKSGDLLVLLGMKCSSWSRVNIGTSLRSICCPAGDLSKLNVTMANCMAARTILLILLVSALKATWLLEQPFQSMLRYYGRFRHLTYVMKVYEASWYMLHYGASSPKRHVMFSNSPHINKLWVSRLLGWKKSNNVETKPCRTYHDRSGKKRFVGTRFLKGTETLGSPCVMFGPSCSELSNSIWIEIGTAPGSLDQRPLCEGEKPRAHPMGKHDSHALSHGLVKHLGGCRPRPGLQILEGSSWSPTSG